MNIVVNEDLKAYIDPLTTDEYESLERSLLAEGCRDALVLWGDVLVDGHNRYGICQKLKLPFKTIQNTQFESMEDVHLWMIDQHLGRRSVSDFQRGILALRKRAIVAERRARSPEPAAPLDAASDAPTPASQTTPTASSLAKPEAFKSREDIAKAARLSSSQVVLIEKIQKQAAPELVAAVKSGTISINAAAAVASLPEDAQKAAVLAGKDELKLAAKRVRDAKRKSRGPDRASEASDEGGTSSSEPSAAGHTVQALMQQVAQLQSENALLRQQVADLQARLNQP